MQGRHVTAGIRKTPIWAASHSRPSGHTGAPRAGSVPGGLVHRGFGNAGGITHHCKFIGVFRRRHTTSRSASTKRASGSPD